MTREEVIEYCNKRKLKAKETECIIEGYDYIIDNLPIFRFEVDKELKRIEKQLPEYISIVCLLTLYGDRKSRPRYKKAFIKKQRYTEEELLVMQSIYGKEFTGIEYDIKTVKSGNIPNDLPFKYLLIEHTGKCNARYSDKEVYDLCDCDDLFTVRHELQAYYNRFIKRIIIDILLKEKPYTDKDFIISGILADFTFENIREYSDVRYLYYVDNIIEINDYANKTIKELFNEIEPFREMLLKRFLGEYAEHSYIFITKMFTPDDLFYYKKRYFEQKQVNELVELVKKDVEELKRKGEWVGP